MEVRRRCGFESCTNTMGEFLSQNEKALNGF